ncbi:molybdenum cofactor biosynthesis protein MoaE [Cellulomonas composti]|uniref:Molybdopterin synthase catalytic subunit 2 n=1 Tax=Cellulomonas composti TaxID=266130 RepID=A0A511J8Z4_9CELL|nr:molybdenum cofactor biosynthesis protein MoaE [Cellulomonas composti]GEL94183.1 molybdopterin synthase catalytic subunit 2 [Cellulomonas composti]
MIATVTDQPLDLLFHVEQVGSAQAGAVATFVGLVRDHDPAVAGEVVGLEYSAHPDAAATIERIAAEVAADPAVLGLAVSHRIGRLAVGEAAIVAAVAAAHRAAAFESCRLLVEQVKAELPVWKRELLADGTHHWVGL